MKTLKQLLILIITLIITTAIHAQGSNKGGMDSFMRRDGRIYVVVAVMLTILAGLILYLIRLDRKISKLEKE